VPAACFVSPGGPYGNSSGVSFNNEMLLQNLTTIASMRISEVEYCTNSTTREIVGLQVTVKNMQSHATIIMPPLGQLFD
jgi:hypothetical protein